MGKLDGCSVRLLIGVATGSNDGSTLGPALGHVDGAFECGETDGTPNVCILGAALIGCDVGMIDGIPVGSIIGE